MRTRIVLLTVLTAALAIALFAVPLAAFVLQHAAAEERAALERVADLAALTVQADVTEGETPAGLPEAKGETVLALYDDHGDLILGDGPPRDDATVLRALDKTVAAGDAGDNLVVAVPVTHDGDINGAIRASIPRAHLYRTLLPTWLAMVCLAGLALLAVWLVARHQARRLARPLEQLAVCARRLGDGDFSVVANPAAIPEIDSVGSALNVTARRLDELIARERAFTADASHQLRTPLTAWRLGLEVALDKPEPELRKAVGDALDSAGSLEQTIDELLSLARDARSPVTESIDSAAVLGEVERMWRPLLATDRRPLQLAVESGLPGVHASAAALRQTTRCCGAGPPPSAWLSRSSCSRPAPPTATPSRPPSSPPPSATSPPLR